MMLPKMITPRFTTVLSNGDEISYRPFLVKERSVILLAMEMKDEVALHNAIYDVIDACTFHKLNMDTLSIVDVEYLILTLRARSVSEIITLNYVCQNKINDAVINQEAIDIDPNIEPVIGIGECGTKIKSVVNIDDIDFGKPQEASPVIMFTETIGVVMRNPLYTSYKDIGDNPTPIDQVMKCVKSVIHGDDIIDVGDIPKEELISWLGELTGEDFEKLVTWVNSVPKISTTIKLVCGGCGSKEDITVEGLRNFLV